MMVAAQLAAVRPSVASSSSVTHIFLLQHTHTHTHTAGGGTSWSRYVTTGYPTSYGRVLAAVWAGMACSIQ